MSTMIDMPPTVFAQLAAGFGDAHSIEVLRASQLHRRVLLVAEIADVAGSTDVERYFELLAKAQAASHDAFRRTMLEPHVGTWASTTLRRLRTAGPTASPDFAYLGGLAAAAATRAGLTFDLTVQAPVGIVMLPTYGRVTTMPGQVRISGADGRIRVDRIGWLDHETESWQPLRHVESTADDLTLRLTINDVDPYRTCDEVSVTDRLDDAEIAHWQQALDETWPILVRRHRPYAEGITAGLTTAVPVGGTDPRLVVNATTMEAFGSILLTTPTDRPVFAESLLHEFQHAKLGALFDALHLHRASREARYYAPWRDDPRPLGGLLHGVYAFQGVTDFWRVERTERPGQSPDEARRADFTFARWRDMVWQCTQLLQQSDVFTDAGRELMKRLAEQQQAWQTEPVTDESAKLAGPVTTEHRLAWRLRWHVPQNDLVQQLAIDWMTETRPSLNTIPIEVLIGVKKDKVRNIRLALANLQLNEPEAFARLCTNPASRDSVLPGLSNGDAAYARGDIDTARSSYLHQLAADPTDHATWVGLGLTTPSAPALIDTPELVYAVHHAITRTGGNPDPIQLAQWLDGIAVSEVPGNQAATVPTLDRP